MSKLKRVVWTKGMFLTPQHFQAQDSYYEDALQFRFQASHFANWGVTELVIDKERLNNGEFALQRCRGVFPDGLPFSMPDADEAPPVREVRDFFAPTQAVLPVYLALPERRPGGKNVTQIVDPEASTSGFNTRFLAENVELPDESGTGDRKLVQLGKRNFRVLFGSENLDGQTVLRIARITKTADNRFELDSSFIPACLNITASDPLMSLLRRQVEVLSSKANSLNASRRQRGGSLADFNTSETATFWLLHSINSYLPQLKHIWSVRKGHPEPLFTTMLGLAGALSTFSLDPRMREFPDYDHDDLGYAFITVDEKIRTLLETVLPSKCFSIPLRLVERGIWSGSISDDRYLRDTQFFLAISAKMGVDDVIKMIPQKVKLSSSDEINTLIRNALPGVTLRHNPSPPGSITFRLENQYFNLNQSGYLWDAITRSRQVSIYIPSDIVEPKIELLVVMQ